MIEYLKGNFTAIAPTHVVVECNGVGYLAHISLHTYTQIRDTAQGLVLTHQVIREDAHQLFGFSEERERHLFRLLLGVSGIGATTARMILSAMPPDDLEKVILSGDVVTLKRVKGIGAKSAERILIDLRDKVGRGESGGGMHSLLPAAGSASIQEAGLALQALGFARPAIDKALQKIRTSMPADTTVDKIVREALKYL
jgi:Holliday junction DNA helicase RuvA